MQIKRHIHWSKIGDRAKHWHKVAVDGFYAPDRVISWVEGNLKGEWTSRMLTVEEGKAYFGDRAVGHFLSEYRFADRTDVDLFMLQFGDHAGSA
jgi:hypothetical protein